jgi:hypothetical protein
MKRSALAGALVLVACNGGVDVVARSNAEKVNDPPDAAGASSPAVACATPATTLTVLTKTGAHLFDASLKEVTGVALDCAAGGPGPLAVDRDGTLWISSGGKMLTVNAKTGACEGMPLSLSPIAMAFVWDPKLEREALYAIDDAGLTVVDPKTLSTTFVGKLAPALDDIRGLAGTNDGWLLAFAGDPVITIAYVDVGSGALKPIEQQLKSPDPNSRFIGGVPTSKGYELVFGQDAYSADLNGSTMVLHGPLFTNDPGVLAVASSPCAAFGK